MELLDTNKLKEYLALKNLAPQRMKIGAERRI